MTMSRTLFSPFKLRKLALANRIVVSPMCQYSAVNGCAVDWHIVHWGQLLQSSAGMFTIEATAVSAIGRITHGCLGLYDDACKKAIGERLAIARADAPPMPVAMQLAHAGRKGSSLVPWEGGQLIPVAQGGWTPVAPSAIPQLEHEPPPAALDAAGIGEIKRQFVDAARRASRLGIDAIELHCAHGYLFPQFLRPLSNRREDPDGGRAHHGREAGRNDHCVGRCRSGGDGARDALESALALARGGDSGRTGPGTPTVLALTVARRGQRHCQCEARHAVAAIVYTVYIVYYIAADTFGSCLLKIARWSR